ncbi:DMT family transporter [Halospeciosus flavus]|uniref:EamA family transporter n=1 Tax=Halospeciosus flavus TaxID=3032283 RepID=A0ABD5Z4B0_9EURY|nr:DMT family transporter [Halospeciosus flavus]
MFGSSVWSVYALVLLAAVLWGAAPVLTKLGLNRGAGPRQAVLTVLAADTVAVWVALLAVYGPSAVDQLATLDARFLALFAVTGALGTGLGRLVGLVGIDRLGASIYAAALSVRPLFATVLGVALLGEAIEALTVGGVVVLVVGLVVLERSREHGGGETGGWNTRDLAFPLLAAAAYAVSRVLRRVGMQAEEVAALEAVATNELAGLLVLGTLLVGWYGRDVLDVPRASVPYFVANGVCIAAGMVAVFTALAAPGGRVVVVDPLVATVPLFTAGFAAVSLDTERVTARVVVGAVLVVVGAVLVVW